MRDETIHAHHTKKHEHALCFVSFRVMRVDSMTSG